MLKKTPPIVSIIAALLVLLFAYTAASKLADLSAFREQLHNQVFSGWMADSLLWILPAAEIAVSVLLVLPPLRRFGFYGALALLLAFTGYISLVLLGAFYRVPCACGGVIATLGWKAHLLFNLFFLLLTIIAIRRFDRERREGFKK